MGKRKSRSPSSSRRRSRSPSSRKDRGSSRHERKRSRERDESHRRSKKGDRMERSTSEAILLAKKTMRESLNAAVSSITSSSSFPASADFLNEESEESLISRTRDITQIEDGEFRQQSFKSTAGGAGGRIYSHKETKKKSEKMETSHEAAMFGPSQFSAKDEKKSDIDSDLPISLPSAPSEDDIFPKECLVDVETRKAQWLEVWREQRKRMLTQVT